MKASAANQKTTSAITRLAELPLISPREDRLPVSRCFWEQRTIAIKNKLLSVITNFLANIIPMK
jgi:hypothetical protein